MTTQGVSVTAISIGFSDSFKLSKELRVCLDDTLPRSLLNGDGNGSKLRWVLDPTINVWPGSSLTVQPLEHRTGIRQLIRRHKKPESIKISAEDLIAEVSNLAADMAETQYRSQHTHLVVTFEIRSLRPSNVPESVPTVEENSTLEYVSQASKFLSDILEIVKDLGEVHPIAQTAITVLSSACKVLQNPKTFLTDLNQLGADMRDLLSYIVEDESRREKIVLLKNTTISILRAISQAAGFMEVCHARSAAGRLWDAQFRRSKLDDFKTTFAKLKEDFRENRDFQTYFDIYHIRENSTRLIEYEKQKLEIEKDKILDELQPIKNSGKDVGFTEGTRAEIFQKIYDWIDDPSGPNLMWLHGRPGAGKSAIAKSLAQKLDERGRLAASFFFQRNNYISNPASFWRTVAYYLALSDPKLKEDVIKVLKSPGNSLMDDVNYQFRRFIEQVLTNHTFQNPLVIVLDALDECDSYGNLLTTLQTWSRSSLPCKLFVTSRPEDRIEQVLSSDDILQIPLLAGKNVSHDTNLDIRRVLEDGLFEIRQRYRSLPKDWPRATEIDKIVEQAVGLFIWVTTVLKYIEGVKDMNDRLGPEGRLSQVTSGQMKAAGDIDSLYLAILERLFDNAADAFQAVVGTIIMSREPIGIFDIYQLQDYFKSMSGVESVLNNLSSVLSRGADDTFTIHHESFADFLTVHDRCPAHFFIDRKKYSRRLALCCLQLMNDPTTGLKFNICNFPTSHSFNDDVDMSTEDARRLSYPCRFWAEHLQESEWDAEDDRNLVLHELQNFLLIRFLYWLEVMSFLKQIDAAKTSLSTMKTCFQNFDSSLTAFVEDAHKFVENFWQPISLSIPHIYLSALPFSPMNSMVSEHFLHHFPYTISIQNSRDADWSHLHRVFRGHLSSVESVAFSTDGGRIVSGSRDKTIRVWDVARGKTVMGPLEGHVDSISSVMFSVDGSRIVSSSFDHTIRIWDVETGKMTMGPLEGRGGPVWSVAFSPGGNRIVSGSDDKMIRIWDVKTGKVVMGPLDGHHDRVLSVAFSNDGSRIVSGSRDRTIQIWDVETGKTVTRPLEGHSGSVYSVAFSTDDSRIVSGSQDNTIRIWDVQTGKTVKGPLDKHGGPVRSVAFSTDGSRIVSGSWDHTIRIWDVDTGEMVRGLLEGHSGPVRSVTFSTDGSRIVSGSRDETIRIWDVGTGKMVLGSLGGHSGPVWSVAFSTDGSRIVSSSSDGTIRIWDVETGKMAVGPLTGHTRLVSSVTFSTDGSRIVSGSWDNTIRIWDVETGEMVTRPMEGHGDRVNSVALSTDGSRVVSGSNDQTIRIWDVETGGMVMGPLDGCSGPVWSVVFSTDGTRVVSGSDDGAIRIWDVETGKMEMGPLKGHHGPVWSIAFSHDGNRIVSGSRDKTIQIWNIEEGRMVMGPLKGHRGSVWSVAFSTDGSRVASGSWDKTIRVWDVVTGKLVMGPLQGHSEVWSVAFSTDGSRIVSGSSDNTVRIWDVGMDNMSRSLEGHSSSVNSTCSPTPNNRLPFLSDHDPADAEAPNRDPPAFIPTFIGAHNTCALPVNFKTILRGWIRSPDGRILFWVPVKNRLKISDGRCVTVFGSPSTNICFCKFKRGSSWMECQE